MVLFLCVCDGVRRTNRNALRFSRIRQIRNKTRCWGEWWSLILLLNYIHPGDWSSKSDVLQYRTLFTVYYMFCKHAPSPSIFPLTVIFCFVFLLLCYYVASGQHEESTSSRQTGMPPLVIPVSVPVRRNQAQMEQAGGWMCEQRLPPESLQQSEHKPSVIVTRRRSLRASDGFNQVRRSVRHVELAYLLTSQSWGSI